VIWSVLHSRVTADEVIKPGGAQRRESVAKPPAIFTIVAILFAAGVSLSRALAFLGEFLIPKNMPNSKERAAMAGDRTRSSVPESVGWIANPDNAITFALFGVAILVMLVFRKDVRCVR
jgi:hypothetical protein